MTKSTIPCFLVLALALPGWLPAQTKNQVDFQQLDRSADWPWWRGFERNGFSAAKNLPTKFGSRENVLWKTAVPGRGHCSPIVVGGTVYLATADEAAQTQSVLAVELATGKNAWIKEISQGGFPDDNHVKNTEASPTLASDGERLFATFFHHRQIHLYALNLDGTLAWHQVVGVFNPRMFEYGYAPSPLIYQDSVIVSAEHDGDSYIAAYDRKSGKEIWRTSRVPMITFSSPVVAEIAGREQLFLSGAAQICAYDPKTGQPLWTAPGTTAATCGTMVWWKDLVIASGGYPKAETIAIVADGSGKIAWSNNQKCYEQSMIVVDGFVYAWTDKGVLYCWRARNGEEMWRERLEANISASPIYADGKIYWANEAGRMIVFRPNSLKFELLASNQIGDEAFASPAVAGNRLLLRVAEGRKPNRQEFVYCIGNR